MHHVRRTSRRFNELHSDVTLPPMDEKKFRRIEKLEFGIFSTIVLRNWNISKSCRDVENIRIKKIKVVDTDSSIYPSATFDDFHPPSVFKLVISLPKSTNIVVEERRNSDWSDSVGLGKFNLLVLESEQTVGKAAKISLKNVPIWVEQEGNSYRNVYKIDEDAELLDDDT
ncbi:hypothetical protein NQ317_013701 [Molorchus minor]|uniref:Uncharacterized protein n=1 Tax=Molorchus minor TaxID=1323400 RepID=A0ABQ9JE54_9CUCU|nr:hypothetical protein NQ317_013701 [Molorchus minor]